MRGEQNALKMEAECFFEKINSYIFTAVRTSNLTDHKCVLAGRGIF
jgi:hypothetical protein